MGKKSQRARLLRYGLLAGNLVLLGIISLVVISSRSANVPNASARALYLSNRMSSAQPGSNPLDQLSAANVAASVASMANLPEAVAVHNQADTVSAQLAVTSAENVVAAEPQVVATTFASRKDIHSYVVQNNDTLASLAAKFNITSDSIKWSNSLKADTLTPGLKLVIPPITGLIYTVRAGDTADSLAAKYSGNSAQITSFNDAEISGLKPGEQIVIPNGQPYTRPATVAYSFYGNFSPTYGSGGVNGYDYGYCTWYVATQIAVPTNWGNASSWAYYASQSGWNVSHTPSIGSIAQTPYAAGGQGHVAIVVAVSPDGTMVEIRDMNGIAGFDRVGTGWQPTSKYPNYISH